MHVVSLHILNAFFLVFHTSLVLFNVLGWAHPRTRRANLATLLMTLFSWTVMGAWYGQGFCICTEWHWQIREELGLTQNPNSYVQFLIESLTPFHPSRAFVDNGTVTLFLMSLAISLYLNTRGNDSPALRLRLRP
ncbi:MAG TPA: DUF2784 domain-containing protein [Fimbriimonas sp.]